MPTAPREQSSKTTLATVLKLLALFAVLGCSSLALGQEVQVHSTKGGLVLSVHAQQAYQLMPGETKLPMLSVECLHKGNKASHVVLFVPGGPVADESSDDASGKAEQVFPVTVNGKKVMTSWVLYGDTSSYAYFGKTEPERVQFLELLLSSPSVSIAFKPFLTGTPTTTVFDLTKLRETLQSHPECSKP